MLICNLFANIYVRNKPQCTFQVKINDYEIEEVEQTKFLVATIDNISS